MGRLLADVVISVADKPRWPTVTEALNYQTGSLSDLLRGGSKQVVTDADKPQTPWKRSVHGMTCLQDIEDIEESAGNIMTSFEQVSVPFIRADTLAVMAIHSWEGFRR